MPCPDLYANIVEVAMGWYIPKQTETTYPVLRDGSAEGDGGENERSGELEHIFLVSFVT